ncbi:unnamed protein product [Dimorphilus gyrociliatus]|uniref:Uncharacterized protein n=1 Tax=Dimorphilus gyrociliatus TaxID=2664684 RepID=A0A7I8VKR1_9ANNE|nr:unnamed protein product [Dimorphilus gyrociliatus]
MLNYIQLFALLSAVLLCSCLSLPESEEKRAFQSWAGKRAFNAWAGKRAMNSISDQLPQKRQPFQAWAGKRGVGLQSLDALDEERKRAFSSWAGK